MSEKEDKPISGLQNPLTALLESAVAVHEIFLTFLTAGFTERQALILTAEMVKNPTHG